MILNFNEENISVKAIEKLKNERKGSKTDSRYSIVIDAVLEALIHFCNQNEEFSKVVLEENKSFDNCLKAVLESHGKVLSDIEAYRRAVSYYFPGADVHFEMKIVNNKNDIDNTSAVVLNLLDLF